MGNGTAATKDRAKKEAQIKKRKRLISRRGV